MKIKSREINDRLIGHLMFAVLFLLAALFYLERTLFVDPCYAVFNLTYFRDFVVPAGRSASVFPQLPALLALSHGLPLRTVLFIYSLSFILLYYLVFVVIAHLFRLGRLALAVPLILVLGVKYSFFWISTETHQALVYTILFYAFLTWSLTFRKGAVTAIVRLVVAAGLLWLCFYSHPVALFTVLFVLGYCMLENRGWNKPDGYVLAAVIAGLAVYKFLTSESQGYEGFFFRGFGEFFDRVGYVFHSESFRFLRHNLLTLYLFPLVIFLYTIVRYILWKAYWRLGWYVGYFVLFALVLFTTFDLWFYPFIQEKNLMSLNLVVLIPFLKELNPTARPGRIVMQSLLVLAFLAGIVHVTVASRFYRDRIAYVGEMIRTVRQLPSKKFILPGAMADRARLNVYWGLATETLLLSSLEGPDSSVSVYVNDTDGKLQDGMDLTDTLNFICVPWSQNREIRRLDRRYFNLSRSRYWVLAGQDLTRGEGRVIYRNDFDDRKIRVHGDTCRTDREGNTWYETSSEFSPGFYGTYGEVSPFPSVLITATVRVMPLEPLTPKWLGLVISREKGGTVLQYHKISILPPDTLRIGEWNRFTVTGPIGTGDPSDQVKVYLWNPEKKRVAMDDFRVICRRLQ